MQAIKKKTIGAALGVLFIAGSLVIGLSDASSQKVAISQLRAARVDGNCPKRSECQGGMVQKDGHCLCMTTEDIVTNETVDRTDLAADKKKRLVVCEEQVTFSKGDPATDYVIRFEADSGAISDNCVLAARPLIESSIGIETDLTEALRAACAPCPISPGNWGPCPACLHSKTPSCAKQCPVTDGGM